MKSIVAGLVLLCGLYFMGAFDPGYSRVVGRPPAQVADAIADLDITKAPGEPGSDASRSGGVKSMVRVERAADRVTWTVMSGDKIAIRMTALLEPVEGGKQTRVRAEVERGDAPDDYVAPAFRSEKLTLGLFGMALEAELNQLTSVGSGWGPQCEKIIERLQNETADNAGHMEGPEPSVTGMMGQAARIHVKISAIETELMAAGCDPDHNRKEFRKPESHMKPADPWDEARAANPDVIFEPGKPMVELKQGR